jgi:hypothetical protein
VIDGDGARKRAGGAYTRVRVHAARVRACTPVREHASTQARRRAGTRARRSAGARARARTQFDGASFAQRFFEMSFPDRRFDTKNWRSPILARCIDLRFSGAHYTALMSLQSDQNASHRNMRHGENQYYRISARLVKCSYTRSIESYQCKLASIRSVRASKTMATEVPRAAQLEPFKCAGDKAIGGSREIVRKQCDLRTAFIAPQSKSRDRQRTTMTLW